MKAPRILGIILKSRESDHTTYIENLYGHVIDKTEWLGIEKEISDYYSHVPSEWIKKRNQKSDDYMATLHSRETQSLPRFGFVYLIKSANLYKIGRALKLKARLKDYRTENPHGIKVIGVWEAADYIDIENKLLKWATPYIVRGEWHKLSKSVLAKLLKRADDLAQRIDYENL